MLRRWARTVVAATPSTDPLVPVAAVARAVAGGVGLDPFDLDPGVVERSGSDEEVDRTTEPPGGWANPWLLGVVHEQAAAPEARKGRGAWYTPEPVVRGLVALADHDGSIGRYRSVVDPTCGGGAFLLAAADRLVAAGLEPPEALDRLWGTDLDEGAVTVTRWSLALWASARGVAADRARALVDERIRVGDALVDDALVDHGLLAGGARLVVGNPPFGSPLRTGAVPESAAAFRSDHSDLLGPYADLAAIHLMAALLAAPPGSVVAMVMPQSVLAGQDTAALRDLTGDGTTYRLNALWVAREAVFDAGVKACAPVIGVAGPGSGNLPSSPPGSRVLLAAGPGATPVGTGCDRRWGRLAAEALGLPDLPHALDRPTGRLSDLATATAGFRDEYYGLVAACRELADADADPDPESGDVHRTRLRLATVGLIDPLVNRWGEAPCRFGGRRWDRPVIDRSALDDKVGRWVDRQARPKVVLATQSKVLEPVVDGDGSLVPATPLVAVHGAPDRLAHVAAVLLAPPVVAWAWARWLGTALTVDGLKLAARQVLELPLPEDAAAWDEAASMVALDGTGGSAMAVRVATVMNRAYGADDAVLKWWLHRFGRHDATDRSAENGVG